MRRRAKRTKKQRHPWRENIEAISMAIIVALLFKAFILEVSKIPSGSMQPTLMGNAGARVYDRVLVDKLSFRFRDPRRWEIVVFKHPLERSRIMVKRLVGMPGEEIKIEHGDVWTRRGPDEEWSIPRRPPSVMREMWRPLDPEEPEGPTWMRSTSAEDWRISGREIRARGDGIVVFHRKRIIDEYVDGYPDALRATIAAGIRERERMSGRKIAGTHGVGDLRLEGRVEALSGAESLIVVLREGPRTYEFRIPGPAEAGEARPEVRVRDSASGEPERIEYGAPYRLAPGERVDIAVENLDDRLALEIEGTGAMEVAVEPCPEQTSSSVSIRLRGEGADLSDLRVFRDVHYLPQKLAPHLPWRIGAEEYFMLGDNTQDSADSRDWEAARYVGTGADGAPLDQVGNWRPGRSVDGSENPSQGKGPDGAAWTRFRTRWGDSVWFPTGRAAKNQPEWPAPTVPRELIQGRALAVFWPLKPHRGLWRLGWLR